MLQFLLYDLKHIKKLGNAAKKLKKGGNFEFSIFYGHFKLLTDPHIMLRSNGWPGFEPCFRQQSALKGKVEASFRAVPYGILVSKYSA